MAELPKEVEKMLDKVQKKKDLSRQGAIDYMLTVATGRLAALWRYDESLPEGKATKGILTIVGRKKRAPKTPKIVRVDAAPSLERKQRKPQKRQQKQVNPDAREPQVRKRSAKKGDVEKGASKQGKRQQHADASTQLEMISEVAE